jgi:hypothetical protein
MRKFSKNLVLAALAASALATALPVMAVCGIGQDDSTCGTSYTARRLVKIYAQEAQDIPAPIVTTPIIQVVQPNTTVAYSGTVGGGEGTWLATATASCGGATLISGGGRCWTPGNSFGRVQASYPSENSWVLVCGADENGSDGSINGEAHALCSN